MDIKTERRNFYQLKSHLNNKYSQEYTTQRFPDDLQYLLDEFIPKASLKQLSKFMDKKFNRTIKSYPQIQKALKKVLNDKLNKMVETIKNRQIQKMINFLKQMYPFVEFHKNQKGSYYFNIIDEQRIDENRPIYTFIMDDIVFGVPRNPFIYVKSKLNENIQKKIYTVSWTDQFGSHVKYFASTLPLNNQKFLSHNGNFERHAKSFLDNLIQFNSIIETVENGSDQTYIKLRA